MFTARVPFIGERRLKRPILEPGTPLDPRFLNSASSGHPSASEQPLLIILFVGVGSDCCVVQFFSLSPERWFSRDKCSGVPVAALFLFSGPLGPKCPSSSAIPYSTVKKKPSESGAFS